MPLSDADTVQSNSGSFEGTSGSASLGVGTTAGNTVMLCIGSGGASLNTPSGFTRVSETLLGSAVCAVYLKSNVAADETSWTVTPAATAPVAWYAEELQGYDLVAPLDVVPSGSQASGTGGTTATSDTTPTSTTYDGRVIALHAAYHSADTIPATFSGHTGGLTETAEVGASGAVKSLGLSVSGVYSQQLAAWQSTATASKTVSNWGATIVVLTAAGAKRAADVAVTAGFEWGTTAGIITGGSAARLFDTQVGSPAIVTSTPRTGTYCLECSSTSAAENLTWNGGGVSFPSSNVLVLRACVRFPASLPAADTELLSVQTSATGAPNAILRFLQATGKLGLAIGGGTEQVSDAAVVADQWIAVDLRVDVSTTTLAGDWQVTYNATPGASSVPVGQAQATLGVAAAGSASGITIGWTTVVTATVRYDDIVVSVKAGHYPLGDFQVRPLKVDPAGTLTISGTTANFNTFTANGTMAAWDATAARGAIDDLPPTIGASADGIAQVTTATGDYVEIPMETYQAVPDGTPRGVRMLACGWAASATAATIGFRGFDGSAETTLLSAADPSFDNSTTDPAWVAKMYKPAGGWTQAKLDALAFRVGFSGDAAPDIGIHAIYAEVAVQMAYSVPLAGSAVTALGDPTTEGILGLDVTAPAALGLDVTYEEGGTPTSFRVNAGQSHTETIDAPDMPAVNRVEIALDPEP